MAEITKVYDPRLVEEKWAAKWRDLNASSAKVDLKKKPFSIMMPPPNVTGMLHMGHILDNTLQDIFIRRARLEGFSTLWQPGTDHAGIATQTKVEKELKQKEGKTKEELGREAFLRKVWEFRNKSGDVILNQLNKIGVSCDWQRTSFTLDSEYSSSVISAFVTLYNRGYIYRGKRMVNWCPLTETAISDEEVVMKPQNGVLYKVKYYLVEPDGERKYLEISTTRPETIMGDTAVAINPKDERFKHLIGKNIWRPFPKEKIPIIGDSYVDIGFGTGCLKVTPAHDKNDFEIGVRHSLKTIEVIDSKGILNELAGEEFCGLERFKARNLVSKKLEKEGLLIEKKPYDNVVGFSERGDVPIEPRLSEQWFLKYPKVEEAKRAVDIGAIKFHPDRWKKTYLHWLNGIQDWCISRQLWWGHQIPVWYKKGVNKSDIDYNNPEHIYVGISAPEDTDSWEQDTDVLDTWASSYLWPMANLGWPNSSNEQKQELDFWYPTSTLVTGFDIIFFWVARMIMAGLELYGEEKASLTNLEIQERIPFRNVYIHGLIRDENGRKMSKSLGNSPDPIDLINKYGADGLRFGICNIAPTGSDILFSEKRIQIGRNFCNKVWNVVRFRLMSGELFDNSSLQAITKRFNKEVWDDYDHWIVAKLNHLTSSIEKCFEGYDLAPLTHLIYSFFWNDFCDWYIEASKNKLASGSNIKNNCLAIQDLVLRQFLQLAHPVIPHITEELWMNLGYCKDKRLIQEMQIISSKELNNILDFSKESLKNVDAMQAMISDARALKAKYNLASNRELVIYFDSNSNTELIKKNEETIKALGGFSGISFIKKNQNKMVAVVTKLGPIYLDLSSGIDIELECKKLSRELEKLNKIVKSGETKLSNPKFMESAPKDVISGVKNQIEQLKKEKEETKKILEELIRNKS